MPWPGDNSNHLPNPGTTQTPPHSSIIGDQGFYQVLPLPQAEGPLKKHFFQGNLSLQLTGPQWLFITFPLIFNKLYYLPYYIHVSCLDASMLDTKNLGIFWSETTQACSTCSTWLREFLHGCISNFTSFLTPAHLKRTTNKTRPKLYFLPFEALAGVCLHEATGQNFRQKDAVKQSRATCIWITPVILATWETEVRRIKV
jgi:hypothetical protein